MNMSVPQARYLVPPLRHSQMPLAVDHSGTFRNVGLFLLGVLMLAQLFLDHSEENLIVLGEGVFVSAITFLYCFRRDQFRFFPFSTMVLLGNNFTMQFGAILFQSLYGKGLIHNLDQPVFTFTMLTLMQVCLLFAHLVYSKIPVFRAGASAIAKQGLAKLGFFTPPSMVQLFILGLVGCIATYVSRSGLVSGGGDDGSGGVAGKILQAFFFLAYLPPVILLLPRPAGQRVRLFEWLLLGGYFGVILILGLIGNSRGFFATYPVILILLYFLGVLTGVLVVKRDFLLCSFAAVFLGALLMLPLSNLAIAMEVVRSERSQISYVTLLQDTWAKSFQPEVLQDYIDRRDKSTAENHFYSEIYFDNPFLNRLIIVKFQDNMFGLVRDFGDIQKSELRRISADKMWAFLPNPILAQINPEVNKYYVTNFSMGDYICYLSGREVLGSFRLGSLPAHGYALFGPAFFVLLIGLSVGVFLLIDSMSMSSALGAPLLGAYAAGQIWIIFTFYSYDSLLTIALFFMRTVPQSLLIYTLLTKMTNFANKRGSE